jgi:hypothetical protein
VENGWREDLPISKRPERFGKRETTVFLQPDERAVMKWNGNPFVLDDVYLALLDGPASQALGRALNP